MKATPPIRIGARLETIDHRPAGRPVSQQLADKIDAGKIQLAKTERELRSARRDVVVGHEGEGLIGG